jgi:hypothetical protein
VSLPTDSGPWNTRFDGSEGNHALLADLEAGFRFDTIETRPGVPHFLYE